MNPSALLVLRWLRECQRKDKSEFNKGYVFGYLARAERDYSAWENQYLRIVSDRVLRGLPV